MAEPKPSARRNQAESKGQVKHNLSLQQLRHNLQKSESSVNGPDSLFEIYFVTVTKKWTLLI